MSGNNEEPITTTTEANPLSTQQQQETKNAPDAVAPLSAESIKQINVDPNAEVPIDYQDSEEDDDGLGLASPGAKTRRSETIDVFKSKGGIKLTWSHLTYKVKTTEGKPKTIISNLSGNALPGRFLAILGPSGGGKSSLTNAITGRLIMPEDSRLDGVVYLNDIVLHEKHKPIVSFVCQDDIVMPKETPLDAFRFSASIRNEKLSAEELELRANDMIRDLKLTSCKDTIMGVPGILKGLSGGEKRRTNIGVELINNPPIVILDEPTSGLDSVAAFRIGKLMRALAHQEGRTVIATIHSPSSELFQLFDDLLLLAKGEVVYHGPAQGLRDYLEAIGRPMPKNVNPCEFAMKLLQSTAEELEGYKDAWKRCAESIQPGVYARIHTEYIDSFEADLAKKEEGKTAGQQQQEMTAKVAVANHDEYSAGEALAPIKNPMDPIFASRFGAEVARCLAPPPQKINESNEIVEKLLAERQPPSLPHQFKLVAARSWRNVVRDPMLTVGRVAQTVIFAVFIGLVYLNLKVDSDGVQDRLGLCFLLMIQTIFLSMMPALMAFPPELAVYLQDQANGMYGPGAFYWAKAFVELPINTIVPLLFCVIIYFMAQLGQTAEQFFRFFCTILVNGYCANGLGMFLGAFAGRKPEAAFVYAPLVVMPLAFVAGLFANTDRLEPGWVWLEWVSFPRYVFKNLIRIEFLPMGTICKPGVDKNCRYPTGEDVVNFLGFDQFKFDEFGFNILMICIIMMFFRLLGMAGLYYQAASQHAKLVFKENHERVAKLIGSK